MPHTSVLAEESVRLLSPTPGSVCVDGTIGSGGHAALILERQGPDGLLVGFDRDETALRLAGDRLKPHGGRVMLIHDDFRNMPERLKERGLQADGILLDLGVSSMQLDTAERGFSFAKAGALDMRMDASHGASAADLVNSFPRRELERIFFEYGEERYARRIAERIEAERGRRAIRTTVELAAIVSAAVPASYRHGRIHPATRVFQALRIAVNDEIGALKSLLERALSCLRPGGRLVIISFHSLEDRLVKRAFRAFQAAGEGTILTRKPVTPTDTEIASNPRSRSAKLRAFEKRRAES